MSILVRDTGGTIETPGSRLVDVIAVPYGEPAVVQYQGEMWTEIFDRGAFSGMDRTPGRCRVNRGHDRTRTVGKVVRLTEAEHGLIARVKVARTSLGDETLALAAEDMLSMSVGFGIHPGGVEIDRRTMTRRVRKAWLDHLSFVESPSYAGAKVITTPSLDAWLNDPVLRWAAQRCGTPRGEAVTNS
ncbi:HK97 family phage prohead protease [Nocardia salmonicida]|uniref:HK97 family phage prohead protease n=1 Tax=Nocardia salmonicida TaxID=53431 RepID=UPI0036259165